MRQSILIDLRIGRRDRDSDQMQLRGRDAVRCRLTLYRGGYRHVGHVAKDLMHVGIRRGDGTEDCFRR